MNHHLTGRIHSIDTLGTVDGPGIRFIYFYKVVKCVAFIVITLIAGPYIRDENAQLMMSSKIF